MPPANALCYAVSTACDLSNLFSPLLSLSRWRLQRESLAWWRKPMSWACCVTVRLPSSSSTVLTSCSSMPAQIWTKCCSNTLSTMSHMRAGPTPTLLRWVSQIYTYLPDILTLSAGHYIFLIIKNILLTPNIWKINDKCLTIWMNINYWPDKHYVI